MRLLSLLAVLGLFSAVPDLPAAHPAVQESPEACPGCGTSTVPRAKFCHDCGTDLRKGRDTAVFLQPDLGIKLSVPADTFRIRTKDFQRGWTGTQCEIESADGWSWGIITHFVWGASPKAFADWRHDSWKTTNGVTNVRRKDDRSVQRPYGEWHRCEITFDFGGTSYHYLELFGRRGSRNVELVFWTTEDRWPNLRPTFERLTDSFEYTRIFRCGACRSRASVREDSCPGCGRTLWPPHEKLARLCRRLGIQVVTDVSRHYPVKTASGHTIDGKTAPQDKIDEFSELLAAELARYPEELFRKLHVERIVLCTEMKRDGVVYGGLAEYDSDTIHFAITEGWNLENFMRAKAHHELFHFLDYRDDLTSEKDDAWEKLNPEGFRYDPKKTGYGGLDDSEKGFLNKYSHTGVGEDKAEVFAYSVSAPKAMRERARRDPILKSKIARIKELARAYCAELDDAFWEALER